MQASRIIPGPGQYDVNVGFDALDQKYKQQKSQEGLDILAPPILPTTSAFKPGPERFDNPNLRRKALMPGPGQYDMENVEMRRLGGNNSRSGTQLSFKSDMITGQSIMGRTKIVNPPSIPSHLNIYGYDVNETGHLIKQSSNLVGFSGNQND